ncbi:hypothetical protein A2264_01660 [candidate division WWE3 bacterium RIFOXYA2_FULL_46_9]|uniref:Peptidase A24A N-terminal domain-containing protein n=1 Tax=candidate division WWE3 bacterium RIFOXYA2_FULL_46_9 TaxID=1802636 RepID=A0A1F4W232_UNCKA|nr:MAG: hypothetical protein A2264_01660 [candidate division WWE3 bacterium RIFOXYA2_FULL_46_9]HLD51209.1 prepilin peptidase [Patescibacteria group bacterium]
MEIFLYYFFIFIAGACIGSFLNVVADRIINGEPIVNDRSRCDSCKNVLSPKNLIPLLSFIWQKGKCVHCGAKLSVFYPISEILTGLLFVFAFYALGIFNVRTQIIQVVQLVYILIIFSLYVILIMADAKYQLVPDVIIYIALACVVIFTLGFKTYDVWSIYDRFQTQELGKYMIKAGYLTEQIKYSLRDVAFDWGSAAVIAFFFWVLVKLTKERGMGYGDINLGLLIGIFNGFPANFLALFLGFVLGSVFSVFLIVLKRKTMKDTIAFGPFLLLGSLVAFGWGDVILRWYLSIF